MNPNAIDTRTVERYSGQPEDFDAWLTRLQVDAYGLNYLDILEGTERVGHGAILTQADTPLILWHRRPFTLCRRSFCIL